MPTRKTRPSANPRLRDIFAVFLRMGAMSFGGGMTSWTRREVVERRGWIDDRRFITGVGLSQISPGANGVNIAVYVGTVLHGGLGALVAVIGMLAAPVAVVLLAGGLYFGMNALPQGAWFGLALAGIAAISYVESLTGASGGGGGVSAPASTASTQPQQVTNVSVAFQGMSLTDQAVVVPIMRGINKQVSQNNGNLIVTKVVGNGATPPGILN